MIFESGEHILFIGDSITDCGRRDVCAPYGNGYMSLVQAFVTARYPELGLRWTNRGIGGNTVRDLAARWDQDVIAERPNWLSVKIGINDVWRSFDSNGEGAIDPTEFEDTYRSLLQRTTDELECGLILIGPYVIDADRSDPQRARTADYASIAHGLAAEFDALWVDTQTAFDLALESTAGTDWAADRIHPNLAGHAIIAQQVLRAIGYDLEG